VKPVDDALTRQLDDLRSLVDGRDRAAVAELHRRLAENAFRVVVTGAQKRGKSTVVNALLARPVLPSGVVPLTAVETTLAYGDAEQVEVRYLDGRAVVVPLGALPDLVTEEGNPANRRGVAKVTVRLSAPLLAKGLELVDTPGTGSVYAHNTATASDALERMDAAIFVLSADPPISAEERAFLRQVRNRAVGLFCLLNKADHLTTDELRQAVAFTERVLVEELGHREQVWPVSARWVLAASSEAAPGRTDHRWDDFTAAFTDYLAERQRSDLVRSVALRAAGLARGVVEDASVTLAGLAMSLEDLDRKMRAFTAVLDEVARSRLESAAVASAEIDRLIRETDEQASVLAARATPVAQQAVANHLGALRGSLDRMEGDALEWVAAHICGVVDGWRSRRAHEVVAALTALDDRLASRLDTQITAVRDSAARLFSVDLPEWAPVGELTESHRFSYSFHSEPGQLEALITAVRTRLPGSLGRRRVSRHVNERTAQLLDQQVGRVRADFQERLTSTRRRLLRGLDARFDAGAGRIAAAIQRAASLRADREAAVRDASSELEERRAAAERLLGQLPPYERLASEGAARE